MVVLLTETDFVGDFKRIIYILYLCRALTNFTPIHIPLMGKSVSTDVTPERFKDLTAADKSRTSVCH